MTALWTLALSVTIAIGATVGNLTLTGAVPLILDVTVTPTPAATNLDLSTTANDLLVANVSVSSNSATGYTVAVRSNNVTNAFCTTPCFYSAAAADSLSYALGRDGIPIGIAGDTGTFVSTGAISALGGDLYNAEVSYDGSATLLAQATDYGETLTFTLTVN